MKSRTYPSVARSQAFPIAPARSSEPHARSSRELLFERRKTQAISGTAAAETHTHAADGKSPPAIPRLVASWR